MSDPSAGTVSARLPPVDEVKYVAVLFTATQNHFLLTLTQNLHIHLDAAVAVVTQQVVKEILELFHNLFTVMIAAVGVVGHGAGAGPCGGLN